jgi:hypothetical protein
VKHAREQSTDRPSSTEPPTPGRLSGVRAVSHDEDERPSREDRSYGETIFNRAAVPLPRFLSGRRKRRGS